MFLLSDAIFHRKIPISSNSHRLQKRQVHLCKQHFKARIHMRHGLVFSLSNAISIEKLLFPQIAIASGSDKYLLFSRLCKHHFKAHIHMRHGLVFSQSNAILIENFLFPQIAIGCSSNKYLLFSCRCKNPFKVSMIFADICVNYTLKSFLSCCLF